MLASSPAGCGRTPRAHAEKERIGLVERLWRRRKPRSYRGLLGLGPVEDGFFQRHSVFEVRCDGDLLPYPLLQQSWGLFSTDGAQLRLLRSDDASFQDLLSSEGRLLEEADPVPFLQLLCDAWMRSGENGHRVVSSAEQLRTLGKGQRVWCDLDEQELRRVEAQLVAPTIEAAPSTSTYRGPSTPRWILEFSTIQGPGGQQLELGKERIEVRSDYSLRRSERRVLSPRVFRQVIAIR